MGSELVDLAFTPHSEIVQPSVLNLVQTEEVSKCPTREFVLPSLLAFDADMGSRCPHAELARNNRR